MERKPATATQSENDKIIKAQIEKGKQDFHNNFRLKAKQTIVSGHLAYENGSFHEEEKEMRLKFSRKING